MQLPVFSHSKRYGWAWTLVLGLVGVGILFWQTRNPVHSLATNLLEIAGGGAVVVCALLLTWSLRVVRWLALALLAAGLALLILPRRPVVVASLRARYVENLKSFEEVPYVWGGESHRGIDCSGLPRRAWREALFAEGLTTLNGKLLREALHQWWSDANARELAKGAGGATVPVYGGEETTAKKLIPEKLQPGDFAVTADGVHVLVYLNGTDWIEADPEAKKVLLLSSCCDDNPWLSAQVKLYRWAELD